MKPINCIFTLPRDIHCIIYVVMHNAVGNKIKVGALKKEIRLQRLNLRQYI